MTITAEQILQYKTYQNHKKIKDPYDGSPFQVYKHMSSKTKGAAFEQLFEEFMTNKGYNKVKNYNTGHDRIFIINGKEVKYEVKGSLIWGQNLTGIFKWQQIRPEQDYDKVIFIAVYPDRIDFFESNKDDVTKYVDVQDDNGKWIFNQHGGKNVRSGTFILQGHPENFSFMKIIK